MSQFFSKICNQYRRCLQIIVALLGCLMVYVGLSRPAASQGDLELPALLAPEEYGDVLIARTSEKHGVVPVIFSHWVHRSKYSCRVCHGELEFSMQAQGTPIVCDRGKMNGTYCASCHNGTIAFGPREANADTCIRCHNANSSPNREKFEKLRRKLPRAEFGNEIDWSRALKEGIIKPRNSLQERTGIIQIKKTLKLRAEMFGIPSAVFPHGTHEEWLDCSSCHPELFAIKKKGTENFTMSRIIKGEFCGVCHLAVAFPLNACRRCHPTMKR